MKRHLPTDEEIKPAVAVYSLMRSVADISELTPDQIAKEKSDIELAHARLGALLKEHCRAT